MRYARKIDYIKLRQEFNAVAAQYKDFPEIRACELYIAKCLEDGYIDIHKANSWLGSKAWRYDEPLKSLYCEMMRAIHNSLIPADTNK